MKGASRFEFDRKSIETETTAWSVLPNGEEADVEQILVPKEINQSKRIGLWVSQSGIHLGKS